jgi:hypothetical protein
MQNAFTLTRGHIRLLINAYFSNTEGVIQQNTKRPFGNSDVDADVFSHWFGRDWDYEEGEMDSELSEAMWKVQHEVLYALQILIASVAYGFSFKPGDYFRPDKYDTARWFPVGAENIWADYLDTWGEK